MVVTPEALVLFWGRGHGGSSQCHILIPELALNSAAKKMAASSVQWESVLRQTASALTGPLWGTSRVVLSLLLSVRFNGRTQELYYLFPIPHLQHFCDLLWEEAEPSAECTNHKQFSILRVPN